MNKTPALIAEKILMTKVLMTKQELPLLVLPMLRPPDMKKNTELHIPVPNNPNPKRLF